MTRLQTSAEHTQVGAAADHQQALLVPSGAEGLRPTIDKATYAWMEKVRCVDGQPQLDSQSDPAYEKVSGGDSVQNCTDFAVVNPR